MSFIRHHFQVRPIQAADNVSKLSLGKESYTPLKTFLRKAALNFHQYNIAKTYVLIDEPMPNRVLGYITLMNSEIILNKEQRPQEIYASEKYESFPAVKIGRLAIDKSLQGYGYGKDFLKWVINFIRDNVAIHVGCRFLVVDSKQESIEFYKKAGFQFFGLLKEHPSMYLDLFHIHDREEQRVVSTTGDIIREAI